LPEPAQPAMPALRATLSADAPTTLSGARLGAPACRAQVGNRV
jgi:hypothetical protein